MLASSTVQKGIDAYLIEQWHECIKKRYKPTQATKLDVETSSWVFTKKRHFQKRGDDLESRAALLCRTGSLGISYLITPCPPKRNEYLKNEKVVESFLSSLELPPAVNSLF